MSDSDRRHDPRWSLLDAAKTLLLKSDRERDALGSPDPMLDAVRAIVVEAGFTPDQVTDLRTVAQSQETVDRDYEGSCFYALR
jgi:hypothetical protein